MAMLKDLKQSMIIVLYLFAYKQNVSAKVKPRPSSWAKQAVRFENTEH